MVMHEFFYEAFLIIFFFWKKCKMLNISSKILWQFFETSMKAFFMCKWALRVGISRDDHQKDHKMDEIILIENAKSPRLK